VVHCPQAPELYPHKCGRIPAIPLTPLLQVVRLLKYGRIQAIPRTRSLLEVRLHKFGLDPAIQPTQSRPVVHRHNQAIRSSFHLLARRILQQYGLVPVNPLIRLCFRQDSQRNQPMAAANLLHPKADGVIILSTVGAISRLRAISQIHLQYHQLTVSSTHLNKRLRGFRIRPPEPFLLARGIAREYSCRISDSSPFYARLDEIHSSVFQKNYRWRCIYR
jgi:hypothetical protein